MSGRILFVHAHPDDEAIPTGATLAKYAAEGHSVTLVTCTLGELGEVVTDDLKHLEGTDALGPQRFRELAAACDVLGVTDYRILGGTGRWRDSGMMGDPGNDDERSFWRADPADTTREMAALIREARPHVLVTYDDNGSYGHPDHIQVHRVSLAGADAAADPRYAPELGEPWAVGKVYCNVMPYGQMRPAFDWMRALDVADNFFAEFERVEDIPFAVPDEAVDVEIDGRAYVERKMAAMRAHASQIAPDGMFFALPDGDNGEWWGVECFQLLRGSRHNPSGRDQDLLAGVDLA